VDQDQLVTWRAQAWELVERNRVRPARDLLGRAMAQFPDDEELLLAAAWVAWLDDENEEAEQLCERILAQDPGSPGARSLLAKVFKARGAMIEAETIYRSLIRDFPDNVHHTADFALMLAQTVHLDNAHELARKAIEMAPDDSGARRAIVTTSLMRGEYQNVESTLKDMMESDPESEETLHSLIMVLDDRGDKQGALRLAQEMLRANPDNHGLVEWIVQLQHDAHWSMSPLRWMDGDYMALGGVAMLGIGLLAFTAHPGSRAAGALACLYALYGALWPPLLKRLQR
jgi:tetratricopeptide (TPR) repeat protein